MIDTPCIGICSTVYGDEICRGCKRNFQEIIDWNGLNFSQREIIWERLNHLAKNIVLNRVEVADQNLFLKAIERFKIIKTAHHSEEFLILLLIKKASALNISVLGLERLSGWKEEIKNLDDLFYQAACLLSSCPKALPE